MTQENIELLDKLFDENNFKEFITQIEPYIDDWTYEEEGDMMPKLALAHFHNEEYDKSTAYFEQVCKTSTDSVMWFNLCTSAILNGKAQRGLEALREAQKYNRETQTDGEGLPTPFMIFYATRALVDAEQWNLAFNQLNELAEIYCEARITGKDFLYEKGVPFFSEFVNIASIILPKQTVHNNPNEWIEYLSSRLDEDGQNDINQLNSSSK